MEITRVDVVVMGGGPAGSVTAALLARAGASVVLLERERFPRFHLGETVTAASMTVLDALGLRDAMESRYLPQDGVRFTDARTGRSVRFDADDVIARDLGTGFHVPRADFDELLLRRARELGVDAREDVTVEDVLLEQGRATAVRARRGDGQREGFVAAVVVDATGLSALLATRVGARQPMPGFDRTALSAHFQGVDRDAEFEGDFDVVTSPHGWAWNVPFFGDVSSLGALCSAKWSSTRARGESLERFLQRTLDDAPWLQARLAHATRLTPVRLSSGFSFRTTQRAGDGWVLVGDAGGFVDPLFGSGTHLAIAGAAEAASAVLDALAARDASAARFDAYTRRMQRADALYAGLARSFYVGDLTDALFELRDEVTRRGFASILAGDVFGDDPPWRAWWRARCPAP